MSKRILVLASAVALMAGSLFAPSFAVTSPAKKKTANFIRIGFFPIVTHGS